MSFWKGLIGEKTTWEKALGDNKLTLAQMVQIFIDRLENNVGKGENAGYQHFLLFPQCFQKAYFLGWLSQESVVTGPKRNFSCIRTWCFDMYQPRG